MHRFYKSISAKSNFYIYRKLAYIFFRTSVKVSSKCSHILSTNDAIGFILLGFNFKNELKNIGVQIIVPDFKNYKWEKAKLYKNAFYKHEITNGLQTI